jgi:hydroxyacylglutathione hydrolase
VEATIHMPAGSPVSYPFDPLEDGDEVPVSASRVRVLQTPGHTPESTSHLLDGSEAA